MIEDELREVFADHEGLAPPAAPLTEAIEEDHRRRRHRRLGLRAGAAAAAVVAVVAVPAVVVALHRPAAGPSVAPLAGGTPSAGGTASAGAATDAPAGRPLTLVVALMTGASPVAVGIAHVPASHDRAYLIASTGDDAAAPGGGCQHLTGDPWLPYLRTNAATGGFASVGTGVLKGLAAITDPARLSRVLAGSGTVSLSMSTGLPGTGDLGLALAGIRTAAGIVEPAGADRTELFRDLAADRLDAYLAAHPG